MMKAVSPFEMSATHPTFMWYQHEITRFNISKVTVFGYLTAVAVTFLDLDWRNFFEYRVLPEHRILTVDLNRHTQIEIGCSGIKYLYCNIHEVQISSTKPVLPKKGNTVLACRSL